MYNQATMLSGPEISSAKQDELYLERVPLVRARLQQGYSPKLGYHGPAHEETVVRRNLRYREMMIRLGLPATEIPSITRTILGASGHDYDYEGFFLEGLDRYFKSPEEYSMYCTKTILEQAGFDSYSIDQITGDQLPTKVGEPCKNLAQLMLCASDLFPIMLKDRTRMKADTRKLYDEDKYLRDRDLGVLGFNVVSMGVLAAYHQKNLNNSDLLSACPPLAQRHQQMGLNIAAMFADSVGIFGEQTVQRIRGLPKLLGESIMNLVGLGAKPTDQAGA